jgi:threonine aldolase
VFYFSFVTTNVTEVAFWLLYRVCQKGRINFLVHSKYSVILDVFKFAASSGAKMVAIAVLYISRDFTRDFGYPRRRRP